MLLRCGVEEAYAQGNLQTALALSRQIDKLQLQRWKVQFSRAS